jgi:hypothetical protein
MSGVIAAPNESRVKGVVTDIQWSGSAEDKLALVIRVEEYSPISGPCFLEKDQLINGFFYTNSLDFDIGDTISAKVEYIGGPHKGIYHILQYEV